MGKRDGVNSSGGGAIDEQLLAEAPPALWRRYWTDIRNLCENRYVNLSNGLMCIPARNGYKVSNKLLVKAWVELSNAMAEQGETVYSTESLELSDEDSDVWKGIQRRAKENPQGQGNNAAFLAFVNVLTLYAKNMKGRPRPMGHVVFNDMFVRLPGFIDRLKTKGLYKGTLEDMELTIRDMVKNYPPVTEDALATVVAVAQLQPRSQAMPTPATAPAAASVPASSKSSTSAGSSTEATPLVAGSSGSGNGSGASDGLDGVGQASKSRRGIFANLFLKTTAATVFVGAFALVGAIAGAAILGGLIAAGTLGLGLPLGIAAGVLGGGILGLVAGTASLGTGIAAWLGVKSIRSGSTPKPDDGPGGGGSEPAQRSSYRGMTGSMGRGPGANIQGDPDESRRSSELTRPDDAVSPATRDEAPENQQGKSFKF